MEIRVEEIKEVYNTLEYVKKIINEELILFFEGINYKLISTTFNNKTLINDTLKYSTYVNYDISDDFINRFTLDVDVPLEILCKDDRDTEIRKVVNKALENLYIL